MHTCTNRPAAALTMTTIRSVKESGSRRLAFCPSILRKIRYVDPNSRSEQSAASSSSRSSSRDPSPDKHTTPQSAASPLAIHVQPQSFQRQPSLSKASCHEVANHINSIITNNCTTTTTTATAAAASSAGISGGSSSPSSRCSVPAAGSTATIATTPVIGAAAAVTSVPNHQTSNCISNHTASACSPINSSSSNGISNSVTCSPGLVESRSITSYRDLRISFFTDDSPTHSQPPTITIRMRPDEQGRFGFNVKGGTDQKLPVLVSRVAPNSPAETAIPKLTEGDQVLQVNGTDVDELTHDDVVSIIRSTKDSVPGGELILLVRPNVFTQSLDGQEVNGFDEEPNFEYVPVDASPASKARVRTGDRLYESMMLLAEGLETGAVTLQFDQLYRKKSGEPMNISKLAENISKNRYRDIMPYDSTRVVLKDSPHGDYINASFVNMEIPSSAIINRYIATQGPLNNTCNDFWLMIWEQRSSLIVSATPLVERGRIKCSKYWPDLNEELEVGKDLKVFCSKEAESPSMIEREFKLTQTRDPFETRYITHIQYVAWPDHGVPEDSSDFLLLVNKVRNIRMGSVDPVVVHCSAGIGRTGVLIMMETAMCLIEANEPIYPIEILKSMRDQRAMLIQTSSQFNFVCNAIYKVYKEGIVQPLKEFNPNTITKS